MAMGALLSPMAIEEVTIRSGSAKLASKNGRSIPIFDAKARHAVKFSRQGMMQETQLWCRHTHAIAQFTARPSKTKAHSFELATTSAKPSDKKAQ
jgi:hypothetical protein